MNSQTLFDSVSNVNTQQQQHDETPLIALTDLTQNIDFELLDIKLVKQGKVVISTLKGWVLSDPHGVAESLETALEEFVFKVFLPNRFINNVDAYRKILSNKDQIFMMYKGMIEGQNGYSTHNIEFSLKLKTRNENPISTIRFMQAPNSVFPYSIQPTPPPLFVNQTNTI